MQDDKIDVTEKMKICFGKVENIVGKGENAGSAAFSPFSHNVFKIKRLPSQGR